MAKGDAAGVRGVVRQFLSLERDVVVLSLAMLAFSLAFQMTGRYVPEYLRVLGAGAGVIGLYGSVGNLIGAVYPYPGGTISDRIGSRRALTLFGTIATAGFLVWWAASFVPDLAGPTLRATVPGLGPVAVTPRAPAWAWVFVGLAMAQAWKSLGLGATFAVVKQATDPNHLARGFASTEVTRRVGFLVGPLLATLLLALAGTFVAGFRHILLVGAAFAAVATVVQHALYDAEGDTVGDSFAGLDQVIADLRSLPAPLRPLLVGDTLVRFANGMVYVFFVIVVTDFLEVGLSLGPITLSPAAFFGILLGVEMVVAIASMAPAARLAERVGLVPVVGLGFLVYAVFPVVLVVAPPDAGVLVALFAFSGLRFAGLPAHKALVVGPAERDAGGRVTGTYYLVRNVVVIPSAAVGGWLYGAAWTLDLGVATLSAGPTLAFGVASAVGLVGVAYFLVAGEEFAAYASD